MRIEERSGESASERASYYKIMRLFSTTLAVMEYNAQCIMYVCMCAIIAGPIRSRCRFIGTMRAIWCCELRQTRPPQPPAVDTFNGGRLSRSRGELSAATGNGPFRHWLARSASINWA